MNDQPEPPQQPFQGRPVYNQPPMPNQQQPYTGYPQQSGTNPGYPQPPYPEQPQWRQPPTPQQPQWGQPPTPGQPQWGQPPTPGQPQWGQPPTPGQPQWGQPPTNNGWQQQPPNPGQFQPIQPYSKKKRSRLWIIFGAIGSIIVLIVVISFAAAASNTANTTVAQPTPSANTTIATQVIQPTVVPTATPSPIPTPSPTPTLSPAQIEAQYKASTTATTVTNLDKDGTADQGKDVSFTCTISDFVKDSSGATAGANVIASSSDYTSSIQIVFPSGTDITQLNQGDTVEVWGNDAGVFSGTNAYGGTIQEVGITVMYMTDQTTNYQD